MNRPIPVGMGCIFFLLLSGQARSQEKMDPGRSPAKSAEKPLTEDQKKQLDQAKKLNRQVVQLYQKGKFAEAISLAQKEGEVFRLVLGEKSPDYATSLNNLAELYRATGQLGSAEPICRKALLIRKGLLGENHPVYAQSLNNLAELYRAMGRPAMAEPLQKEALEIRRRVLGENHPEYAQSLNNLALAYLDMSHPAKAEPLLKQALEIRKNALGENHPDYALSLTNLGGLYSEIGQPAKAEALFRHALEIRKRVLGENHPDYATSLSALGLVYEAMSQPAKAEPLYRQAMNINKRVLGENHPDYCLTLNNLAGLYRYMDQPGKAEPLILQALEINKRVLGDKHPDYATNLNNLGNLYQTLGQPGKAEPLLKEALDIRKQVYGDDHFRYASTLNDLAVFYSDNGQLGKAEQFFIQALEIQKRALGENHPNRAIVLINMWLAYLRMGQPAKAGQFAKQAQSIAHNHLVATADGQAENAQQINLRSNRFYLDNFISSSLTAGQHAYGAVLTWKGSLFLRQQRQRAFAMGTPESRKIQVELQDTSRQLGRLYNSTPRPEEAKIYQEQLGVLTRRLEDLETELSRRSAPFAQAKARAGMTPEALSSLVPPNTALVDLLEYWHYLPPDPGKTKSGWERRYLAWVVRPGKPVAQVPLGSAKEINDLVSQWRAGIRNRIAPAQGDRDPAVALRDKLLGPLLPHLEGVETLLISPDSQLGTLPFAALPGRDRDKYLIEEMEVAVVPFAQSLPDLLEVKKGDSPGSLVVLGDVAYGGDPGKGVGLSLDAARGEKSGAWTLLPGTKVEVENLAKRYGGLFSGAKAELLEGEQATEQGFREKGPGARWLHIATHGYFSPPEVKGLGMPSFGENPFSLINRERENAAGLQPGLLSGIVLAGANRGGGSLTGDDGILTASEVQDLNLSGVEQAVLSACETGLGQSAGGEGLLGLQRAFQLAGCRTVVASMWKVPDRATQELMTRYYENLWEKKLPKGKALREAQLWLLRESKEHRELFARGLEIEGGKEPKPAKVPDRTPPVYWAAWTLSGAWR